MSFEPSQINYIHLVSWPSVWLPPSSTQKVFVCGLDQPELDQLVSDIQIKFPNHNWAIYYDLQFDQIDPEHLDWLLINASHCEHIWFNVREPNDIYLALFCHSQLNVGISSTLDATLSKLCDFSSLSSTTILDFCSKIVQQG